MGNTALTPQRIGEFYNDYKKSIKTVNELDQKLLEVSDSYDNWNELLDEKSRTLREIFGKNYTGYEEVVGCVAKDSSLLTPELSAMYLTQIDCFISEGYRDYGVTAPVLRSLIGYFEAAGDYYRTIDAYYFMGVACGYSHRTKEAYNYFTKVLTMCPEIENAGELYRQYRVACASYFRLLTYVNRPGRDVAGLMVCYNDAFHVWRSGAITGMISMDRLRGLWSVLRSAVIYGFSDDMTNLSADAIKLLQDEYEYQLSNPAGFSTGCLTGVVYNKFLYQTGQIEAADYVDYLIMEYKSYSLKYKDEYTFGTSDFISLFKQEVKDDDFKTDKLFFMNPSCSYMYILMPELLATCPDEEIRENAIKEIHQYFLQLPMLATDGTIDIILVGILNKVLSYCADEGRMIESIHNLFAHRQIATAIHSRMVGELAKMITDGLVTSHPTLFYGIGGMTTRSQVAAARKDITNFVWRAGCLHDVGKLLCTDVINLQIRRIIDEEYESIKTHPTNGYYLLKNSAALSGYAMVAGTHHKFYDDSKGYPAELNHSQGPERIFEDIVAICDVTDAAMDLKGRNYAKGKTFEQLFDELKADKGTRYSAAVIDAIDEDKALQLNINEFLEGGRRRIQYEVYRRFVLTDVQIAPSDEIEKFMRPMKEEDIDDVAKATGKPAAETTELFDRCRDHSFLMLDGDGKLYGTVMSMSFADKMIVMQIFVRRENRRQGIGTQLIENLKANASKNDITHIYVQNIQDRAGNSFAGKVGFVPSDRAGYLMLRV